MDIKERKEALIEHWNRLNPLTFIFGFLFLFAVMFFLAAFPSNIASPFLIDVLLLLAVVLLAIGVRKGVAQNKD